MGYDEYLQVLRVVRRRAQMLNASLGDLADGGLIHGLCQGLHQSLEQAIDLYEPEFGELKPRVPEDPMVDAFVNLLLDRVQIPDSLESLGDTDDNTDS